SLRSIQSNDTLAKIGGTVGLLNSTNYLAFRLTGTGFLDPAQVGALSQISAMLAIANLTHLGKMIEAGQIGSAGASVVSAINGVGYLSGASSAMTGAGAIIAINPIALVVAAFALDSLFGNDPPPPPPQASASFFREASGVLRYRISEANPLGESIMRRELDQLLAELNKQINQANEQISLPAHRLEFIASRMPTLQIASWPSRDRNGVDNYFFIVNQQDPLQGGIGTLGIARQDLLNLYADTLLVPEAIVQRWELDHLRAMFGRDESKWLTEAEWLRERSPTERQRAQLQAELARTTSEWKAASQVNLILSETLADTKHRSNVTPAQFSADAESAARSAMNLAQDKLSQFNSAHPIDPTQAARVTPEQMVSFAPQRTRDTVALQWLKVLAVDLGNDGIHLMDLPDTVGSDLESFQHQAVARFDVDNDGFLEATQWIEPADAILGIDRSGNNLIDNGSELFNDPDTPFDQHGLGSLAYFDANHDGLLTPLDPAFKQLRLWLDLDGDGSAGQLEVFDLSMHSAAMSPDTSPPAALASMVVTAVDLVNAQLLFADGGSARLTQLNLLAQTEGVRIAVDPQTHNLNVLHENGLRENFITLVDDMSALQELLQPSITAARRSELYALASRYGLSPLSPDFASVVQSLRATGQTMAAQDTVIYFNDDDIWVDNAARERLEQMRISFRKINDATRDNQATANIMRVAQPLLTESIGDTGPFDDRWVHSRHVGMNDIISDTPASTPAVTSPTAVGAAEHGKVSLEPGGDIVFTPDNNFNGEARFSYTVMNASGLQTTGYALVSIDPVNDAPISANEHIDSREDEVLLIDPKLLVQNELDVDIQAGEAQRLTVIAVDQAVGGTVELIDGMIQFTPGTDHNGSAGFQYTVSDGAGGFVQAKVAITLAAVNDAPCLPQQSVAILEDSPLSFPSSLLLNGATDVDSDVGKLSITSINNVIGGTLIQKDGQLTFCPLPNFNGTACFDYTVADDLGASSTATLIIDVNSVNDAPTLITSARFDPVGNEDQEIRIAESALVKVFSDADGDAISIDSSSLQALSAGDRIRFDEARRELVFRAA
ncbi:MAG: tandem-95 repeat protein, partial [Oxalobacteraceae bacterium]|nr:tandem-95 repeat protein [Oxalobacteraceae bacterium]